MARSAAELEALRRVTDAYVAADEDVVTFYRASKAADNSGGWTYTEPEPQEPVGVRVQPSGRLSGQPLTRTTPDGRIVTPEYEVVTRHDTDIRTGDTFTWEGKSLEVVWVTDKEYEKFGEVIEGGR